MQCFTPETYNLRAQTGLTVLKLRIPYLLAAMIATASFSYLADTNSLKAAPVTRLKTTSGDAINLAAPEGKARLVTFWAPDCPISKRNVPVLSSLYEQYAQEAFEVISVAMPYADPQEVDRYIKTNQISYPVAIDQNGETSDAFPGVRFTPTTFLIDGNGEIVWKHVGRIIPDKAALEIVPLLQTQQLARR